MGCGGWIRCCSGSLAEAVFNLCKAPQPFPGVAPQRTWSLQTLRDFWGVRRIVSHA